MENLPTSDGVEVGVEGTVYFSLNTDPQTLTRFDDKYGTRRYPTSRDGSFLYAWEDEEGWSRLPRAQVVRSLVISNDLREGDRERALCRAAGVVRPGAERRRRQQVSQQAGKGNVNIAKIQNAINASLADDLTTTLGGAFASSTSASTSPRSLCRNRSRTPSTRPRPLSPAVTEAQAKVQQAKAEAQANLARQQGYVACPACAQIDTLKAIPPNVTTFAPGAGFAVDGGSRARGWF